MKQNNSNQKNEIITGVFFIAATVAAIIGLKLYDPVLKNTEFLLIAGNSSTQIALGAFFEAVLACSAMGTGIMLYPFLKRYSESWALGYTLFRLLEVVFILIGVLSMLSITKISQDYINIPEQNINFIQASGNTLRTVYSWAFIMGPHFMLGINTFIYSSVFYKSKLVPGKLAVLGITGALLIFIAALLELFGVLPHFSSKIVMMALPIAVYEMILAMWLIMKGFNKEAYEYLQN